MKHFDLNIDKILENWEVFHAVRELIANALDEHVLTGTDQPQIFHDSNGWWHIRDFGRGVRYQDLIQTENPEKVGHPNLIGKFGIGLKDALATFDRRGIKVLIRSSSGDISLARVNKHSFEEIVTLHATVEPPTDPDMVGTDCCIFGVSESDIESAKNLFLAFSTVAPLEVTRFGTVLARGDDPACIYINGMKVAEEENFLFSYNITSLNATLRKALNRERQNLGRSAYSDRIRGILLGSQSEDIAAKLSDDLQQQPYGDSHDELSWLDVQEHAVRILSAKRKVLFISSTDAIMRPEIIDTAKSSGYQVLTVTDILAKKIEGITDTAGQPVTAISQFIREHNESFQFTWISPDQLTPQESSVWQHLDRILAHIGGRPRVVSEIRISETMSAGSFMSHDTLGLWDPQNRWIILKRSILASLDQFAGILLHEAIHAKYAVCDVSRDFEHYLTELCGSLAAKVVNSESKET